MAKILLIDAEPGMQTIISKVLVPAGHEVVTVESGRDAVETAKTDAPELTFLDIRLPDMETVDCLAQLKKTRPSMPVVILSSLGDSDAVKELSKKGAFGFIAKPFKVSDLVNITNKALNKPEAAPAAAAAPEAPAPAARKRKILLPAIGVCVMLAAAGAFFFWQSRQNLPPEEFPVAYANPSGIAAAGNVLWVSDWGSESVYRHAKEKDGLKPARQYVLKNIQPSGVAFDGEYLWTSHAFERRIYKHALDDRLTVKAVFESPGPSPSGLFFDGKNLWSLDFQKGKIYQHAMDRTLSVRKTFDSPAENPSSLFAIGEYLYLADAKTNKIFKMRPDTLSIAGIYTLPSAPAGAHVSGMTHDGTSLWACFDEVPRLYRFSVSSLKKQEIH